MFFSEPYSIIRDLLSFPTRRSSDLSSFRTSSGVLQRKTSICSVCFNDLRSSSAFQRARYNCRSEEHTSELQSPDQLVCRLLLEKKKQRSRWTETAPADTATDHRPAA